MPPDPSGKSQMATNLHPVEAGETRSFDGTQISFEVYGRDGPAIVCCNGIACTSHAYWDDLVDEFGDRARIVLFDYRGHGRSGPPEDDDEILIHSFARDAAAVMDAAEIDSATLVGHSMGVQVILETYRSSPARVDSLIAVAGPFERPLGQVYGLPLARALLPLLEVTTQAAGGLVNAVWRLGFDTGLPFLLARASLAVGPRAKRKDMENYFDGLGALDLPMLVRMFRAMDSHSAADVLEIIDVPTLVIAGEIDMLTPVRSAREMARRIPGAELVVIPMVGHALPIEAPKALHDAITTFLDQRVWTESARAEG